MAGNTAQVYDQQGNVYQAVQLTQPTVINGMTTPAGWWSVTDQYGNTSAVRPDAFNDMFSPAQGIYLLGQPGGAASLNNNGLVVQHSQYEGQAGGVATLDNAGNLVQNNGLLPATQKGVASGLATLDVNGHVAQPGAVNPVTAGQPNGLATLNAGGTLAQTSGLLPSALLGVANGVASLDGNGEVVQAIAQGIRKVTIWQPSADVTVSSGYQNVPSSSISNWGSLATTTFTVVKPSASVVAMMFGNPYNYSATTSNWCRPAVALDSGTVYEGGLVSNNNANSAFGTPTFIVAYWSGLASGNHTVDWLMAAGGGGGLNPACGFKGTAARPSDSWVIGLILEF